MARRMGAQAKIALGDFFTPLIPDAFTRAAGDDRVVLKFVEREELAPRIFFGFWRRHFLRPQTCLRSTSFGKARTGALGGRFASRPAMTNGGKRQGWRSSLTHRVQFVTNCRCPLKAAQTLSF